MDAREANAKHLGSLYHDPYQHHCLYPKLFKFPFSLHTHQLIRLKPPGWLK